MLPSTLHRLGLSFLLITASVGAFASVLIETKVRRYRIYAGIRPDVVFCVDGICDRLEPAEARQIASALVNAADEQDAKK